MIFQSMLNLNPSKNLWTLSPWKSQLHLISTGRPCVIYHAEKHCSAGPSIQPEIQCVERKGNLHGEKQRQTENLLKIVDTRGSKGVVVLPQDRGKGCLWWAEEGRNKHAGEMVLPKVFKVRFQSKMKKANWDKQHLYITLQRHFRLSPNAGGNHYSSELSTWV